MGLQQTEVPSVDVVIPAFNCGKFIVDAIKSIENQTIKPKKVIIVNDGSVDNTLEVISQYRGDVRLEILNKGNGGVSSARNWGIEAATSEYVAFLDADDVWFPEKLEYQLELFKTSAIENLGVVYCRYHTINENGATDTATRILEPDPVVRGNVYWHLMQSNKISGSSSAVLVKRECFARAGVFDENLAGGEDHDMWLRIAKNYGYDYVDRDLVGIRQHASNAQSNEALMFRNQMYFCNKWSLLNDDGKLLRKWGRSMIVQLMIRFLRSPNTEDFHIADSLLLVETKKRLFSVNVGSTSFYRIGFAISFIESLFIVGARMVSYAAKKMFRSKPNRIRPWAMP